MAVVNFGLHDAAYGTLARYADLLEDALRAIRKVCCRAASRTRTVLTLVHAGWVRAHYLAVHVGDTSRGVG